MLERASALSAAKQNTVAKIMQMTGITSRTTVYTCVVNGKTPAK